MNKFLGVPQIDLLSLTAIMFEYCLIPRSHLRSFCALLAVPKRTSDGAAPPRKRLAKRTAAPPTAVRLEAANQSDLAHLYLYVLCWTHIGKPYGSGPLSRHPWWITSFWGIRIFEGFLEPRPHLRLSNFKRIKQAWDLICWSEGSTKGGWYVITTARVTLFFWRSKLQRKTQGPKNLIFCVSPRKD